MIRILIFLVVLAAVAFGATWFADRPGDIALTWQGYHVETSVAVAAALVAVAALILAALFGLLGFLWSIPARWTQRAKRRRREKGHAALSRGMIAIGAGDVQRARKSAAEAGKHLPNEPLTLLLDAQAAQLSGDRAAAEAAFTKLTETPQTKLLGLRGLHIEAQRRGDGDAAQHFAEEAHKIAPLPWSTKAVLEQRAAHGQWASALAVLDAQIAAKLIDRKSGERQRAVLETALAQDKELTAPDEALALARKALGHAPDLVPASVLAARLLARRGELRKAAKTIETAWDRAPHPELAEAYLDLRAGDSNADRLAKARTLARIRPDDPESHIITARAALAARNFAAARTAMAPLIADDQRPTARMCLIMAELEDRETGDEGKVREWLARGARAPRDPAWMADGIVAAKWAPVSPATGRLDAFVWQKPADRLSAPVDADSWIAQAETSPPRPIPNAPLTSTETATAEAAPAQAEAPALPTAPPEVPAAPVEILLPPKAETRSFRANGTPGGQKVIFPMPGAPDDPGPNEGKDAPEDGRVGLP